MAASAPRARLLPGRRNRFQLRRRRGGRVSRAPVPIAPDILDCGYAAESSFGAASWLVLRPGGNVLVDSPRHAAPLVARIRALGGARFMFLTHRDDVADRAALGKDIS